MVMILEKNQLTMINSFSLLEVFFLYFMLHIKQKNCGENSPAIPSLTQNASVQSSCQHLHEIFLNKNPTNISTSCYSVTLTNVIKSQREIQCKMTYDNRLN